MVNLKFGKDVGEHDELADVDGGERGVIFERDFDENALALGLLVAYVH